LHLVHHPYLWIMFVFRFKFLKFCFFFFRFMLNLVVHLLNLRFNFLKKFFWNFFLLKNVRFGRIRLIIWTFLESPRSSFAAKLWSFASALFVLLSLACLILSSMSEFQLEDHITPVAGIQILELWFNFLK